MIAELFRADGRTDMTKLIVAFCNLAKVLKNKSSYTSETLVANLTKYTANLTKYTVNLTKYTANLTKYTANLTKYTASSYSQLQNQRRHLANVHVYLPQVGIRYNGIIPAYIKQHLCKHHHVKLYCIVYFSPPLRRESRIQIC